jgi:hypothetical protein
MKDGNCLRFLMHRRETIKLNEMKCSLLQLQFPKELSLGNHCGIVIIHSLAGELDIVLYSASA